MTYFADLSPYTYHARSQRENTWNVGWLDAAHPFSRGEVSAPFLSQLWAFCGAPVVQMRGFHTCELCNADGLEMLVVQRDGESRRLGAAEIRVFAPDGRVYAAPDLIYHYVAVHGYCPPDAFVTAVLEGPQPGTDTYERLVAESGLG
ncbi:MAG: hypothetical protein KC418_06645 [Anaerolineales bacterium]|nr:hypothetical protein [Anaerolineales bacterium]MCB8950386.1 hypothetical protein [Ardenticatenales bacterium]